MVERATPQRIVVIGAGGIGAPLAWALIEAGASALTLVDEDMVELGNLHRQVLFEERDVGRPKTLALAERLRALRPGVDVLTIEGRALPGTVMSLVLGAGVVVDATDNFPSRFLLADAAHLASVPIVHAAAVRWQATVLAVPPGGGPCYRCLFEDVPTGPAPDCATAGVVGSVCGVAGALAADHALCLLEGDASVGGRIVTYDGLSDRLRSVPIRARSGCILCGDSQEILAIDIERYTRGGACA
ncbi:MAG: HesA/MoeB/ThiF family protein [Deltaproteobacteria bacterium]|nr:HesA/MoeB/ThiF family protein [Deltaproteobacteria bacterium]